MSYALLTLHLWDFGDVTGNLGDAIPILVPIPNHVLQTISTPTSSELYVQ